MSGDFRVIVTGSRDWGDGMWIRIDMSRLLFHADRQGKRLVLVHGAHRAGVDQHVQDWADGYADARKFGYLAVEPYPADWSGRGSSAGPVRNQHMVDLGADLCLAYPLGISKGTRGCARFARKAQIPTLVTEWGPTVAQTLEHRLRAQGIMILEGP